MTGISLRTGFILSILLLILFVPAIGQEGDGETGQSVTSQKFESLKERIDQLEGKIEGLVAESNDLNEAVSSNQKSLNSVKTGQSEMSKDLKGLENTVKNHGKELDKVAELNERVSNLENKLKKLVGELGRLNGVDNSQGETLSSLEKNYNSIERKLSSLEEDLSGFESSLTKLRENTFENEKRLASFEETYRASARRNLLVAASGIVVGLVGLTLFWAS